MALPSNHHTPLQNGQTYTTVVSGTQNLISHHASSTNFANVSDSCSSSIRNTAPTVKYYTQGENIMEGISDSKVRNNADSSSSRDKSYVTNPTCETQETTGKMRFKS